jgi:uncharacterized membrane protein YedE/YeeE
MAYWPFWLGGLVLAAVPLVHWLLLKKMFAVTGRYSSITDWLRGRAPATPAMSEDELVRALARETAAAFGEDAVAAIAHSTPLPMATPVTGPPQGIVTHLVFLLGVMLGGTASVWLAAGSPPRPHLLAGEFTRLFGDQPLVQLAVLLIGGTMVGFGTRMAGGCTSGHGLCGVSRLQPGSLLATACFFGMAIAVSFGLQLALGHR